MEGNEKEGMEGDKDDEYEGAEEEGYEDDYVGFDDDLLSFGGAKIEQPSTSFLSEAKTSLQYRMKITNTEANAVDRTIALCPGYFSSASLIKDANGTAVDAIIVEGTVIGTAGDANRLIANGSAKTIDEFFAFVKYNPTKLIGLKILVDNATKLEEKIYTKQNSPFRNLDDVNIEPSNYKTSKDTDSLRAEVPIEEKIAFDNQTTMVHKILSGRTTTITWFFGAILNTAAALAKKSCKAKVTIDRIKAGGKGRDKRKPIRK